MAVGITSDPLAVAQAKFGKRSIVASRMGSREWAEVPIAIRERALFSARVESVRFLQAARDKLTNTLAHQRERVAHGEALVDRSSFIGDMRRTAVELGIQTTSPQHFGGIRDIRSAERLGLIYDMQTRMATEFAQWKSGQDPDILDEFPAQRFIRQYDREDERPDWDQRWAQAVSKVGGEGVAPGQRVALKTSPVWEALSAFGDPWPPFDYGSGMGVEDVDRDEAVRLGLLGPDEQVLPVDKAFDDGLQASAETIDPDILDALEAHAPISIDRDENRRPIIVPEGQRRPPEDAPEATPEPAKPRRAPRPTSDTSASDEIAARVKADLAAIQKAEAEKRGPVGELAPKPAPAKAAPPAAEVRQMVEQSPNGKLRLTRPRTIEEATRQLDELEAIARAAADRFAALKGEAKAKQSLLGIHIRSQLSRAIAWAKELRG